jgi:KUP system potassium uptake protein
VVFTLMTTWRTGRQLTRARLAEDATPLADLIRVLESGSIPRIPGTAVFPTGNPDAVPTALEQSLRHMRVLHERVILLTVHTRDVAHVDADARISVKNLGAGVHAVVAEQGFMEDSDVPAILATLARHGLEVDVRQTTFYLRREIVLATKRPGMAIWRERLYARLLRNARNGAASLNLPADRVVEVGTRVEI